MKNNFLFTLILLLPALLIGQTGQQQAVPFGVGPDGVMRCATVQYMEELQQLYPDEFGTTNEYETWLQEKIAEAERNGTANSRMVLTIPVVFHIIHDNEPVGVGDNISAAQVQSAIDVLNEDFRRKVGTAGFNNDSRGADVEIEFCAAFWGPDEMPLAEPGIDRINRRDKGWNAPPYVRPTGAQPGTGYIETTLKAESFWDPDKYFNIWVADIVFQSGAGTSVLLGYAQFPSNSGISDLPVSFGSARTDGIIVRPDYCGRIGSANNNYVSRTVTHEAGHWLGLRHIWGDGPCGQDDFCADTPESDDQNFGCNPNHVSCGSVDMVRNYMDYSTGTCQNIFSQCQATRMRTALQNGTRRASLLTSDVCDMPTTAPVSGIEVLSDNACAGIVQFADSSQNLPTQWFWTFGDGGTSTMKNPTHTYTNSGTYTVTLTVVNNFGTSRATRSLNVSVSAAASVDAGPDLVTCAGDLVPLNANISDPSASIRWNPTQGLLNPTSATPFFQAITGNTYFVTVTDSNGCSATDTLNITVVIKPQLNVGNDVTIQPGSSVTLNATLTKNARNWRWTPVYGFNMVGDDTLRNPRITPDRTVTYTMTATDVDGCVVEDEIKEVV